MLSVNPSLTKKLFPFSVMRWVALAFMGCDLKLFTLSERRVLLSVKFIQSRPQSLG